MHSLFCFFSLETAYQELKHAFFSYLYQFTHILDSTGSVFKNPLPCLESEVFVLRLILINAILLQTYQKINDNEKKIQKEWLGCVISFLYNICILFAQFSEIIFINFFKRLHISPESLHIPPSRKNLDKSILGFLVLVSDGLGSFLKFCSESFQEKNHSTSLGN